MFIPTIPQASPVELHCNNGASTLEYCQPGNEPLKSCIIDKIQGTDPSKILTCNVSLI